MAFVVNPAGATHSVHDELVELLLGEGFRVASEDQVVEWFAAQGLRPDGEPLVAEAPKAAKPKA